MENLKLQGEIITISDIQEGVSQKGNNWKKLGFLLRTIGEYPVEIYFTVFGEEKVDNFMKYNKVGQMVDVSFNANSREYQGKYYTDLSAWKIFVLKEENAPVESSEEFTQVNGETVEDDLPF